MTAFLDSSGSFTDQLTSQELVVAATEEASAPAPTARSARATALEIHTLDEAAVILRVKRSWLERQAASRKIPFTMLGGAYHFTSAHLAAIVRIHERTPTAEGRTARRGGSARYSQTPRPSESQSARPLRPRPRPGPRSAT